MFVSKLVDPKSCTYWITHISHRNTINAKVGYYIAKIPKATKNNKKEKLSTNAKPKAA